MVDVIILIIALILAVICIVQYIENRRLRNKLKVVNDYHIMYDGAVSAMRFMIDIIVILAVPREPNPEFIRYVKTFLETDGAECKKVIEYYIALAKSVDNFERSRK